MKEIELKNNPLSIRVYAVGEPDIDHMTEEEHRLFVSSLELRLNAYMEQTEDIRRSKITETYEKKRAI